MGEDSLSGSTRLLRAGRPHVGWVNTPVTRASTYVFESVSHWRQTRTVREEQRVASYGARGTDSTFALEDALVELEGGHRAQLFPTGQAAIANVMLGLLQPGDHVLVTDAVYEPVRRFCAKHLARLGINVEFYMPDGSDLAARLRPETKLIYAECPGSLVFEMIDLPAVAELARRCGCLLAVDNTWGSGLLYRPLSLGADISVLAATKYLSGHADVMMGALVTNERAWKAVHLASVDFGQTVGADDAYLVLRGLRSLAPRMAMHERHAMLVAQWLEQQPQVTRVICPALPNHPGHELWRRDFHGTNGLLSVEFRSEYAQADVEAAVDRLRLFGVGASWGGFESLVVPTDMAKARTISDWSQRGRVVRLHIGLENPEDLIADLRQAFRSLEA
ncbi:cystathionine beta-lyase [Bradyrhizobium macuxiense]|uniref:Cystathionine beta-lyase n=1 Tax=Bradyrhizobium macuxiense TaxID=1755647 RepID=A0A120FPW9_9BRAD|nr:cystathionine beta-lyase [Bradyrhizobium macuxiense]KWV57636.1 cystathionine beta-lyase [Bradyrhizobium macuxiense]